MSHRQRSADELTVRANVDLGPAELVRDVDRPRAWTLLVAGTPQSHVDLDDALYLEFEYMRRLGHLIDLATAAPAASPAANLAAPELAATLAPLRVLHLGGGGLTLARYVAATRPGSSQLAVDCDAALVELVRDRLPLDQPGRRAGGAGSAGSAGSAVGRVRVRVGDARAVLEQVAPGSFDVVVADLFAGARTAAHLTSAEFAAAAAGALTPAGIYAANIGDGPPLAHTRSRVAAASSVFPYACLIADAAVLKGRRFGNLVLAASRQALPVVDLARRAAGDPFPGRLLGGGELDRFVAGARPITDAQPQASPAPPASVFPISTKSRGSPAADQDRT